MSIKCNGDNSYAMRWVHLFRFTMDTEKGILKYFKASISFFCERTVDCDNMEQYINRFNNGLIAKYLRNKGLIERVVKINNDHPKVTKSPHTPTVTLLSYAKLQEFECSILDYINAVTGMQYQSIDECDFNNLVEVKLFIVQMIAFMSLSERYSKVDIKNIVKSVLPLVHKRINASCHLSDLYTKINQERDNKLKDINEYSIVEMLDDCQEQLRYSTKYFKNKSKGIIGDDELPELSRGAYDLFSTNNEVRTEIEKKLSNLLEVVDSAQEEHKLTAICNYVVERVNHEILYSESRHSGLNFTKDNWSDAAIKERDQVIGHVYERYQATDKSKGFFFRNDVMEKCKPGGPLATFGNCDHFANKALEVIKTLESVDVEECDFGMLFVTKNQLTGEGHATAYLRYKDRVMVIDPWENMYYNLKYHEHFLNYYLVDECTFKLSSRNNRYSGSTNIGEIQSNEEYSKKAFKENVDSFFKQ
ncbi:MAG: hypothetical protein KAG53_05270 [Endozoicomonadaceae bacterium]|nr:hypothetical protein [Endozoicomonadaceae bacterium]